MNQNRVTPSHPLMSSSDTVDIPTNRNTEPVMRWSMRSRVMLNHGASPMRLIQPSIAGFTESWMDF